MAVLESKGGTMTQNFIVAHIFPEDLEKTTGRMWDNRCY